MVLALPKLTVVLGSGVYCEMFQIDAAGMQTTVFPHQGKLSYHYVSGKQLGYKFNCLFIYLFMHKFKLNIFLFFFGLRENWEL